MTSKMIAAGACESGAGGKNEQEHPGGWIQDQDLLYRLSDETPAYNRDEIRITQADGSHTIEARTRRAGELLDLLRKSAMEGVATGSRQPGVGGATLAATQPLPQDLIDYVKGIYAFLQSTSPSGYAEEVFRLPASSTPNQRSLQDALQGNKCGELPAASRQNSRHEAPSRRDARVGAAFAASHPVVQLDPNDSLLLCVSDLQRSAVYDSYAEMRGCVHAVAERIRVLATSASRPDAPKAEAAQEPAATIKGWTNGSYSRNYELEWHRSDLPEGAQLYAAPQPAVAAGWAMVPIEPNRRQVKAAADAWLDCGSKLILNKALAALRAGIAAAPIAGESNE